MGNNPSPPVDAGGLFSWRGTVTRGQWLTLAAALIGWAFDGFEMGVFPIVARKCAANLARDIPAICASSSSDHALAGSRWISVSARASRPSASAATMPPSMTCESIAQRSNSSTKYSASRSTAACLPSLSPNASANSSSTVGASPGAVGGADYLCAV